MESTVKILPASPVFFHALNACVGSVAMTIAIVVGLLVVGIGLVLSQLFRLKDWLNRQPPPPPAEHPETPGESDAS